MKTAVELLESEINKVLLHLPLEREGLKRIIQQAKEIEKENLKDFYFGGINFELYPTTKGFEEYYSETFKSDQDENSN